MIKHGTKYINESEDSEWFDELNLDNVIDAKTGRMLIPPPIGTEVTIKFIEDIPCHGHDRDHDEDIILDGEVIQYSDDNPDVILIMFHGGWQQECGWDCATERRIPGDNGNKCYWIHIAEEEVYLKGTQRIQESEEDDLEWAKDAISQNPIPNRIKLGDNKRFVIPSEENYSNQWYRFSGWNSWKAVTGTGVVFNEDCYMITDSTYGDIYIPMSEFKQSEIEYKYLNESEDLGWAEDAIKNTPLITVTHNDELIPEQHQYYWIETINVWNRSSLSKGGTKVIQMGGTSSPEYRIKFFLERGGYVEITSESIKYIVNDVVELSSIPRQGALWGKIRDFLLSLQVRIPMNESEDLEWAQDAVSSNPSMAYAQAYQHIDNDDIISVSGDLTDDDVEAPNVLCVLNNSKFKVYRKHDNKTRIYWLEPRNERPQGWEEVTNTGGDETRDNLILYHGNQGGFNDDDLNIEFIEKVNHPF